MNSHLLEKKSDLWVKSHKYPFLKIFIQWIKHELLLLYIFFNNYNKIDQIKIINHRYICTTLKLGLVQIPFLSFGSNQHRIFEASEGGGWTYSSHKSWNLFICLFRCRELFIQLTSRVAGAMSHFGAIWARDTFTINKLQNSANWKRRASCGHCLYARTLH